MLSKISETKNCALTLSLLSNDDSAVERDRALIAASIRHNGAVRLEKGTDQQLAAFAGTGTVC